MTSHNIPDLDMMVLKQPAKDLKDDPNNDERLILNVGGIKYETFRSTLAAYPDTLLGTMFQKRNNTLLHPLHTEKGVCEYFFDRNGRAFHYILEYYRTGKLFLEKIRPSNLESNFLDNSPSQDLLPQLRCHCQCPDAISYQEILAEIDYFQIPYSIPPKPQAQYPPSSTLDSFILMLKSAMLTARDNFDIYVEIVFPQRNKSKFSVNPDVACILNIVKPYAENGYAILDTFGDEIGCYLTKVIPNFTWSLQKNTIYHPHRYFVDMSINSECLDKQIVLSESKLLGPDYIDEIV
ncbi:17241_t:CDS:2 [Cetraspora pellucida]|uniref:17241_t:CDS:1 n=1 Tax=Cetraspora pellucida TaxID=1433469 RepID=A0A9N9C5Z4_9GLOM|nr:17241_t:CDS:2 [Cetraspora pellucida]